MQQHAPSTQTFSFAPATSTPVTKPSPPSIPYPISNSTRLSGTTPLSGSGIKNSGILGVLSLSTGQAASSNQANSGVNPVAQLPPSWSPSVLASESSAAGWAKNPACTASWRSRVAANNGTVITTQSWRSIGALNNVPATTVNRNEIATGPTTIVSTPTTVTYTIGHDDVCCGQCQVRYPDVRVYYWPVNSTNTWCLSLEPPTTCFHDSSSTSSGLVGQPRSSDSLDLHTLTSSIDKMPSDLPNMPTVLSDSIVTMPSTRLLTSPSSLDAATETVPVGLPKLTPRDTSHVTPAPSLPSIPAEMFRARTFLPLNHTGVYAQGPDGFIL